MTNNDGEAWGGVECAEAEAELRQVLATRMKRSVPPDLVVTTRTEIENREFRAYGQGWRDRGEHEERRRAEAHRGHGTAARPDDEAKVLPFPHQQHPPRRQPPQHPYPDPHPPAARPHPSDDEPS